LSTTFYFSDLAYNQPASQISTVHGAVASRAVDGITTTAYSGGSCTHTNYATDARWRVDLGSSLPVAEVVIVNRACRDACATYLTNFEIRIGKTYLFSMGGTRRYRDCQLSILMTAG